MVSVQILRAIAVLMAVALHVLNKAQTLGVINNQPFTVGAAGVDLFFIISGFIMVYITNNKNVRPSQFLSKRLIRILPLYWFMTTLAAGVFTMFPALINSQNGDTTIIHSYTLLPTPDTLLLTVAWTLRYEFMFYIVFACSIWCGKSKYLVCAAAFTALSALSLLSPSNFHAAFFTNPIMIEFVIGMACYYVINSIRLPGLALIAVGMATLYAVNTLGYDVNYRVTCYSIPMALIFVGVTMFEHRFKSGKSIAVSVFKYIGDASYSIYLTHIFTLGVVSFALSHHFPLVNNATFVVLSLFSSVIAGVVCYEVVEEPLTKYVRRIFIGKQNKSGGTLVSQ